MEKQELDKVELDWEKSRHNEVIKALKEGKSLSETLELLSGFKESFRPLDTICCSDGRVVDGHKIGIAGSGMLLSAQERAKFIENYKGKVKKVTAHRDCGAAGVAFKALTESPEGITTPDDYGIKVISEIANDLESKFEFLDMGDMANEEHNEVAITLDQTGMFDSDNLEGFPPHFVCTGPGLGFSSEYMKTELAILAGIALEGHGYGSRFTEADPLYIMVIANNDEEMEKWQNIATETLGKYGSRVEIKGYVKSE